MKFNDFLLTIDGMACIVWVDQLSVGLRNEEGASFVLMGMLEVHEDFVIVHNDSNGTPTAIRIADIKCIEPSQIEEEVEEEEESFDVHAEFEKYYKEQKGKS